MFTFDERNYRVALQMRHKEKKEDNTQNIYVCLSFNFFLFFQVKLVIITLGKTSFIFKGSSFVT